MVVESGPRVGNADVERGKLHGANRTHQIHGISNYITTCLLMLLVFNAELGGKSPKFNPVSIVVRRPIQNSPQLLRKASPLKVW